MIKKEVTIISAFFLICSPLLTKSNPLQFRLPVRIIQEKSNQSFNIKKEYIKLLINEKPVEIVEILKRERSLSDKSEIGRHFFMSFQLKNIDKHIINTVSYFVTEILKTKDTLHVISPKKVHYLKVSGNKVALLSQIEQIIKSDYQPYFQIMQGMEKRIEDEVKKLHWSLRNNPGINSQQSALDLFIKNFSFEFSHYKKDFLFTNLSRTQAIENLLPNLKGDRWFFHFQQNRFFYFLKKLTRLIQSLRQYRYLPLLKTIINYQNEIKASNLFPFESVRDLMVENNIIFNVLLINEPESNQSDIKENLQKICRESGGILLAVKSARTSLEKIKIHKDHFYEIVFNINNKIEEKNIQILAPDYFEKLCYKQNYSADEISSILSNRTRKKVKVDNIMIFKNRISFLLESYEINKKKGYGLIKVQVDVASPHNQTVFHTENTLRATRDQTLVSIQMPFYKSNIFTLTITAYDLMTNHSSEIKHQVQLQETFPITLPQQDLN